MTIVKKISLYALFVRFNENGFQGAHVSERLDMIEDGVLQSSSELPERAVTQADIIEIMGEQSTRLIEAVQAAQASEAGHREARTVAEAAAADAIDRADRADKASEALQAEFARQHRERVKQNLRTARLRPAKAKPVKAAG